MKKSGITGNRFSGILFIATAIMFALGQIAFAAPPTPIMDVKSEVGKVSANLCSDPSVKLVMNKALAANTAKITLTGTVCNTGAKDYVGTASLDAFFMVYTWHPPKTPAMEGDVKVFSHRAIGNTLKKGECRTVTEVYTIPGVTKWNHTATTKTERQAAKEFVFGVEKKYPLQAGDTSFSKTENCNMENDRASATVYYMEAISGMPVGSEKLPIKGIAPKETRPDWLNPQPEPPMPK